MSSSSTEPFQFSDPEYVARYAEGPPRFVPGFADLHRMVTILLAEAVPQDAKILVLGAGGGMELKSFAQAQPAWSFVGVDPSVEMLKLAAHTLGPLAEQVHLHQGYIETAPSGLYDGATCLLTLHFLDRAARRQALAEVHRRLKPGAPFITVQASLPEDIEQRSRWLTRYSAFAKTSGVEADQAEAARQAVKSKVHVLSPEQDEAMLREAGFQNIGLFYAAFLLRGWLSYA